MKRDPRKCFIATALTVLTCSAVGALGQAPAPDTSDAPFARVPVPVGATPLPQARAFIAATVDLERLGKAWAGQALLLDVAPGRQLTAAVRKVERRSDKSYSIFGDVEGMPNSTFIIAVENDVAAADILCPSQGEHYRFKYAGNGVHLICDVDDDSFAPCGGAIPAAKGPNDADPAPEPSEGGETPPQGQPRGACTDVEPVFDAMIVYTDVARVAAGGANAIHAEIQLAVDRTNESYANSPIFARYRLVWREEVVYDEVGEYGDHLDRLTSNGSAPWPGVRATRNAVRADFCTLWVDDSDFCGLAHCTAGNSSAFSVVTWSCAAGNLSHPHELGHNQGCGHDPDNGGCGTFSYGFGHRFTGNDSVEYRTVMAYAPGVRIPFFSNPNQTFAGVATGTASRDNARVVNERRATCANFQATRYDIWVDFAFGGSQNGTFSNPYNTITAGVNNIAAPGLGASELPNLYVKQGVTTWTGTITNGMRVRPCGGVVRIGD